MTEHVVFDPLVTASLITAAGALMGVIIMKFKNNDKEKNQDLLITDVRLELAKLQGRYDKEREIRELRLIQAVHSPHLKSLDALLQKVTNDIKNNTDTITVKELREAITRLDAEIQNIKDRDEPNMKIAVKGFLELLVMIEVRLAEKEG